MRIEANIKDWLLNVGDPSLRYRTLTELLKTPVSDPEVKRAREEIDDSKAVNSILSKMEPDGSIGGINPIFSDQSLYVQILIKCFM